MLADISKLKDYEPDAFMQVLLAAQPSPAEAQIIEEQKRSAEVQSKWLASEAHRQATKAGMRRAAEQGIQIGRPKGSNEDEAKLLAKYPQVAELLGPGKSLRDISARTGVAVNTVRKVKAVIDAKL